MGVFLRDTNTNSIYYCYQAYAPKGAQCLPTHPYPSHGGELLRRKNSICGMQNCNPPPEAEVRDRPTLPWRGIVRPQKFAICFIGFILPYNNPNLPFNKSTPPYNNWGFTRAYFFISLILI
jgi:hypothetical protein